MLVAILLPVLISILGLVLDGGLMICEHRALQHATDAAATAAAMELRLGESEAAAAATASQTITVANQFGDSEIVFHTPPQSGPFAGRSGFVEVQAEAVYHSRFIPIVGGLGSTTLRSRAVAGSIPVTSAAAIVVLDPDPHDLSLPPLPSLPVKPSLIAGLEIEGLGTLSVDGAILVNNTWGGVDENGDPAGDSAGPPYGVSCTPLVQLTRALARDLRVVGGVDAPENYGQFSGDDESPLQANRLPVPDPYAGLPAPTVAIDAGNVAPILRGAATVAGVPLIGPATVLQPGIYEYIRIVSGTVRFEPGVYVIRNKDPVTQMSLSMVAGSVDARGVLFYITDTATYDGLSGDPDAGDSDATPPESALTSVIPSVLIQDGLLGPGITGLNSPGSPFDGMVIYQRRQDRRPIVIVHQSLLGAGVLSGAIYAKWGHVTFLGNGVYDLSIVCGTLRVATLLDTTIAPSDLLPPATDVVLAE